LYAIAGLIPDTADTHPLDVDLRDFATQQHVNPPIAVAHARLGDLLDVLPEGSLPGTAGTIVIARTPDPQSTAGSSNADLPGRANVIDHLALPGRLHIFPADDVLQHLLVER
jgi:hypothetical protein